MRCWALGELMGQRGSLGWTMWERGSLHPLWALQELEWGGQRGMPQPSSRFQVTP